MPENDKQSTELTSAHIERLLDVQEQELRVRLIKLAAVGLGGLVGGFAIGWKKGRLETSKTDDLSP